MRDRQHQTETPRKERSSFADNKSAYVHLPKIVPTQKNRALMRDTTSQIQASKIMRLLFTFVSVRIQLTHEYHPQIRQV